MDREVSEDEIFENKISSSTVSSSVGLVNRLHTELGPLFCKSVELRIFYKDRGYHSGVKNISKTIYVDPGRLGYIPMSDTLCVYNVMIEVVAFTANKEEIHLAGAHPLLISNPTKDEPGPIGAGCIAEIYFYTDSMVRRA